jgi:hypothetical protein
VTHGSRTILLDVHCLSAEKISEEIIRTLQHK